MSIALKYRLLNFVILTITSLILFSGCSSTKYVPEGKYLLNSAKVKIDNKNVKKEELKGYIKQKSNKKILGFKFHLGLYNLSNINKEKGINNYLRTIGEVPSIWDPYSSNRTVTQLKLFMQKKGYHNAVVSDSFRFNKRKVDVIYFVKANDPYTIRNISYTIEDTVIQKLILPDTINSLVKRGNIFDMDVLASERGRIENLLKNRGYYNFSKDFISFDIFTTTQLKVDIVMSVKNPIDLVFSEPHKKYKIRNVTIIHEKEPVNFFNKNRGETKIDSVYKEGLTFIYSENCYVKPSIILQSNYILPGAYYSLSQVDETRKSLNSLNVFSIIGIQFIELPASDTTKVNYIDCQIRLTPSNLQSNTIEVEGTNSSGNVGGALNLVYQHGSLFGNAESLTVKLRGAIETIKQQEASQINKTIEYGAEASINFPKFLLPFNNIKINKKYNPKTAVTFAYNFQQRPDYTRKVANVSFGYNWKQDRYTSHILNPIEMNYVEIPYSSPEFDSIISGTYLENSYTNHLVPVTSYSVIYNTQNIKKSTDFHFVKFNLESAGSILTAVNSLSNSKKYDGHYELFGIQYSQYIRSDIDFRYYDILNQSSSFVYRLFAGAAVPYGNASAVPFEKQYFSGGANSIRGWQVRTLGPGSYKDSISTKHYPNSTGDIKLEANFEYRFKLFWILESAMFVDAGNIWVIKDYKERPGAVFKADKFINDLAVASGIGLRFDLKFFLFRTDVGLKMRDPSRLAGDRWIFSQNKVLLRDFAFSIAIAYPF